MNANRDFKGVWISRDIWLDKSLTLQEKCFLVEIDSLDNDDGCFASNAYFADFFQISKGRCTQVIKSLEAKKRISITIHRKGNQIVKRVVRILNNPSKLSKQPSKNPKQPYLENAEDNNTNINNTNIGVAPSKKNEGTPFEKTEYPNLTEDQRKRAFEEFTVFHERFRGVKKNIETDYVKNFQHVFPYDWYDIVFLLNKGLDKEEIYFNQLSRKGEKLPFRKRIESWLRSREWETVYPIFEEQSQLKPLDDFKLSKELNESYKKWLRIGKEKYPALWKSDTRYLSKKNYFDLIQYFKKENTRVYFTAKEFEKKICDCLDELNVNKFLRDSQPNVFDFIMKSIKKQIQAA